MAQVSATLSTFSQLFETTSVHPTHSDGTHEYQLKHGKTANFWKMYGAFVDEKPGAKQLTLCERIGEQSPLILELDLSFEKSLVFTEGRRLDDEDHPHPLWAFIYEFVAMTQQLIVDLLEFHPVDARGCVVMKPTREYAVNQRFHWLFRVHFPMCHLDTAWQHSTFLPELHSACRQNLTLAAALPTGFRLCSDWDTTVTLPKDWQPMFKSRKNLLVPEMEFGIVLPDLSNLIDDEAPECEVHSTFPFSRHMHIETGQCRPQEIYIKNSVTQNHILSFVLSQWYATTHVFQPKASESVSRVGSPTNIWDKRLSASSHTTPSQGIAESLLPMLSPSRFEEENTWMDVGRALYVTYLRQQRGLDLWKRYTEMHSRGTFTYRDCERMYTETMCDKILITYRTIGFYARADSPDAYKAWHRTWCENDLQTIYNEAKPTHADVAALIAKRYWLELVYEKGSWYEYLPKEHGWVISHKNDVVAERIVNDFLGYMYELRSELTVQQTAAPPEARQEFEKPLLSISRTIAKLKDESFFNGAISQAKSRCIYKDEGYSDRGFSRRLDKNPRIIRCPNGVLEAISDRIIFRTGKPEDYLTMCTGVSYPEEMTIDSQEVVAFKYWMRQMFVTDDLMRYMMNLFSSVLVAGQNDKILPVWYGNVGNNGKSTLMDCCKKALGNYHAEISTSVATKGRTNAGNATPEYGPLITTRMACMKEPEPNETFHIGTIKELTGNDTIYIRKLFEEGSEAPVMAKIFLHCNDIPNPSKVNDPAFKNRITIIPFETQWSHNAPQTPEEQRKERHYKIDPRFGEKMYSYARAWLWLAVQNYPEYVRWGVMHKPDEIVRATHAYWDRADYYKNFRNEKLEVDAQGKVSITEMYGAFLEFLETDFQKKTSKPTKPDFRENIKKTLAGSEFKGDFVHGWRLRMTLV